MGYIILSDSTCSLDEQSINECGVKVLSLSFIINEKEYLGSSEKNLKFFYNELRKKENASTSCINTQRFIYEFEEILKKDLDILYLAFSSNLSATYQNAIWAASELQKVYPERTIRIIDTLSASSGEGLIVYNAGLLKKQGKSLEEVANWVNEYKYKTCHLFTVDDLFYLYRGGRVKQTSYLVASLLKVKPLMHMPNDGSLQAYGKVIGRKKAITQLISRLSETIVNPEEQTLFICHGDCREDVEFAIKKINETVKLKGIKVFYTDPVVGVHSGPGTLAFFYFAEERA